MSEFENRDYLITGAASGIGRATAVKLLGEGARVWCMDLPVALDASIDDIKAHGEATAIPADVSREDQVASAIGRTADTTGGILHGLVNCAAVGGVYPFEEVTWEDWKREMRINVFGTYVTMKHCARLIRAAGGGAIVNIASNAAKTPSPISAPYNASKAAVISLTRSAAKGLAPQIRVNSICPGHVETPLRAKFGEDAAAVMPSFDIDDLAAHAPLGRAARPEELADAVLFLLGSSSGFMTGEDMNVNGGMAMY